ncbi:MAG: PorT family protein [Saprospiraceae bacterium]|nr:PorT family protein [Saprospiraceae bacterium]
MNTLRLLFFFCFFSTVALAQETRVRRFNAGPVLGFSASQIDGDNSQGYNKPGLIAGLHTTAFLNKRFDASIEFLFAQRGSQSEIIKDQDNPGAFSMTLNYVEVPLQIHVKDWFVEDDDGVYHKISLDAGFSYARFMSSKIDNEFSALNVVAPDYINKNDFSFVLGASFYANRHWGFNFRWVRGITSVYDPNKWNPAPVQDAWRGHCLYFAVMYML